jgi:hypothetical protein
MSSELNVTGAITCRDLHVTGTKAAVVVHPDGSHRALYALESPESWFEDFGRENLVGGTANVQIDLDFAALVDTASYHVFLTPEGPSKGLYVATMTPHSFRVCEQEEGRGNITFSYRVVARRGDVTAERLPEVTIRAQRNDERHHASSKNVSGAPSDQPINNRLV